ncbi:MAG: ribosome silencing factor [Chloroflexi bacterium]|nr:ribosome silencing factor [Chloroflexota bacterium]
MEDPLVSPDDARESTATKPRGVQPGDIEYAQALLDTVVDRQGADVVLLDLSGLTVITDYFIIATVDNMRQAQAVEDAVGQTAAKFGYKSRTEGSADEGWILVDAGNGVFVHLFSLEARVYYDLEGLWHRAQEIVRVQ